MDLQKALFELSACAGPSGAEKGVYETAASLLEPFVDDVTRDLMGNLIGIRAAEDWRAKTILLDAHLDEVGLLVTDYDRGFLKFTDVGVDPRLLPGLRVKVCTEPPLPGVISCLPPHATKPDEREKAFPMEELRIDCGLTEEEAPRRVPVGTRVVYDTKPFLMGGKKVCAKSLDDRSCFVILCRVMELLKDAQLPVNVCVLGSVQEEFDALGATVAAFNMMPSQAIVVDVSFAETPDTKDDDCEKLGTGPQIGVGPVMNRAMSKKLRELAKEKNIPFKLEPMSSWTGTNADDIQMSREGVAVCCVSLLLRYMHTPLEVVNLEDIENCAKLIAEYILSLKEGLPC
ncbi:MAG: M42 family peptidase [Oscillospiraceae bacterium]|nr:M42 family peptidase [Oscillospiraceae bacterium]